MIFTDTKGHERKEGIVSPRPQRPGNVPFTPGALSARQSSEAQVHVKNKMSPSELFSKDNVKLHLSESTMINMGSARTLRGIRS